MASPTPAVPLSLRAQLLLAAGGFLGLFLALPSGAADPAGFHQAPASAAQLVNPYKGQAAAATAGGGLYAANCAACHGRSAEGTGNIPALAHGRVQQAADGEIFWFISKGAVDNGMPSWAALPEQQRWQIVTYLKTLTGTPAASSSVTASGPAAAITAPPPPAPFTDFRYESPGTVRKIGVGDLPAP